MNLGGSSLSSKGPKDKTSPIPPEDDKKYPVFGVEGNPFVCLRKPVKHPLQRKDKNGDPPKDCKICAGPVAEVDGRYIVSFLKKASKQDHIQERNEKIAKKNNGLAFSSSSLVNSLTPSQQKFLVPNGVVEQDDEKPPYEPLTLEWIEGLIKADEEEEKKKEKEEADKKAAERRKNGGGLFSGFG